MKYFIFRNMTIERMFSNLEAGFSGYEDISYIPDVERYIWFYLSPMNPDNRKNASSITDFVGMLSLVLQKIKPTRMVIAFSMRSIYSIASVTSDRSLEEAIASYNSALVALTHEYANLKVVDFSFFTNRYGSSELIDWKYYFISQMAISPKLAMQFQFWFESQLKAIELNRKKCIILDLDNTLWGGVLGEDGIDGVKLGGDYPGKAFLLFQKQLKELSKQGVMLAVCSKNNLSDVQEMWERHPDCMLKEESFTICKINWQNKADNIRQIANELNIGLDSMIFIDDNPSERALINQEIPDVEVPDFPEFPYNLPLFMKEIAETYFSIYSLTEEDISKTEQYKINALRNISTTQFTNMYDYIRSLEIVLKIEQANKISIPRIAQMTQKTNQFNLTTKRYIETDIYGFISQGYKIFTISVEDKFGNSGITGVCIIHIEREDALIDSFLLSCRILGKDIEFAFVTYVLSMLQGAGIISVFAQYIPTPKNSQVEMFYDKCGFECVSIDESKIKHYRMNLSGKAIRVSDLYRVTES